MTAYLRDRACPRAPSISNRASSRATSKWGAQTRAPETSRDTDPTPPEAVYAFSRSEVPRGEERGGEDGCAGQATQAK
jgi:hypothetical protein